MSKPGGRASGTKSETIPVLLIDDHAIWREGVRTMLTGTEFEVVGEAGSGREGVEVAHRTQPRLALVDIRMAGGDGFEALTELKAVNPALGIIMLTTYENPTYIARAVAGGAAGYLNKGVRRQELLEALRAVARGEMLLSSEGRLHALRAARAHPVGQFDLPCPLTEREVEILRLLATGMSNAQIGALLFIGTGTVKTHVEHIIGKLGVSDRVQAAVWALQHGIGDSAAE